jgi:hypothetical protein
MPGMTAPLSFPIPDLGRQGSLHHNFKKLPSRNNANGLSEETNIYTETRMLQDQTGRLCMSLPMLLWIPGKGTVKNRLTSLLVQCTLEMRPLCPFCS